MSAPLDVERPQPKDTKGSCGRLRTREIANDSTVPGQKRSLMADCELASAVASWDASHFAIQPNSFAARVGGRLFRQALQSVCALRFR